MKKIPSLELRRQFFHLLYGPFLVVLHHTNWIDLKFLFGVIIGGGLMSLMIKKERIPLIRRVLSIFEREKHLETFPGRGILFFTIGAFLTLWIFLDQIHLAYAGILVLSVGDAVSNLLGRYCGKIKTPLNPNKFIEGTFAGILFSMPIAYYFVPNFLAAFSACTIAMFLELPDIKLFGYEIDDNLIIPVAASYGLSLFA